MHLQGIPTFVDLLSESYLDNSHRINLNTYLTEMAKLSFRSLNNHEMYIIVLNLGSEIELIDLHDVMTDLPAHLEVVAASMNAGYDTG